MGVPRLEDFRHLLHVIQYSLMTDPNLTPPSTDFRPNMLPRPALHRHVADGDVRNSGVGPTQLALYWLDTVVTRSQ